MEKISLGFFLVYVFCLFEPIAAATNKCSSQKVQGCTCPYNNNDTPVGSTEKDHRPIGLAATVGVLSGTVLTGAALTTYLYFKGRGGSTLAGSPQSGDGFGGGGGGSGDLRRNGSFPSPRPDSARSDSSDSTYTGSESPLTKRGSGDHGRSFPLRPYSGASPNGSARNIYRQGKVWPGRF